MKGKSYNRGIRAHKLAMETLFRLMWNAFVAWYAGHTGEDEGRVVKEEVVIKKVEECRRAITTREDVRVSMEELQHETTELRLPFQNFTDESRTKSKMFVFWEKHGHMVKLLLHFIKAERTGNWELHLCT